MTPSTSDRPRARRTFRLATGLLLVVVGMGGGLGVGLLMPRTVGAEPSPAIGPTGELPAGFEVYQEALDVIRKHYVDSAKANDGDLVEGSIRGMVDALGDTGHTVYLTADELHAENDALDGRITGIGVTVDARHGSTVIISVMDGSPADQAGLRIGDEIIAVDGTRTDRSSTEELVRLIRGEAGTTVEVRVRGRDGATREVSIVRAQLEVPAVTWAFVPGTRIAVIRMLQFSSGAGGQVATAARDALAGEASSIVLDLRGNPGGLLDEAITVASAFIEDGVVYRSIDRDGHEGASNVRGDAVVPDLPMVVLVDYGSASSAEIVAAALADSGRARVVGETTYGTGTVLNVYQLADGSAIRLGVQHWLTPDGETVFGTGLTPDVTVDLPADGAPLEPGDLKQMSRRQFANATDTQLRRAVRLLADVRA